MKLIHSCFVKDEEHCIGMMLESILPYVEESYILIDDRTTDDTEKIAKSYGCYTKRVTFENFGKFKNTLMYWINNKADWSFGLAPDELITSDFGKELSRIISKIDDTDIDSVYFSRRHWGDLEMTNEIKGNEGLKGESEWYPDWQQRLLRIDYPRIHAVRYVHEIIVGVRRSIRIQRDMHHFNTYWKPKLGIDWDNMLEFYEELKRIQARDGGSNIWPNEELAEAMK